MSGCWFSARGSHRTCGDRPSRSVSPMSVEMEPDANCKGGDPKAAGWAGLKEPHPELGHPDVSEVTILVQDCLGAVDFGIGTGLQASRPSSDEVENFGGDKDKKEEPYVNSDADKEKEGKDEKATEKMIMKDDLGERDDIEDD